MTPARAAAIVWSAAAVVAVLAVGPLAAAAVAFAVLAGRATLVRRRRRRVAMLRAQAIPELVDLFLLAAAAGLPVAPALHAVAPRAPPPVRPSLVRAEGQLHRGVALADVLRRLGADLGPGGTELAEALAHAAASGTPLVPVLDRVAATARDRRTRAAEEAARRLPVALLFPLACCTLPAAVLLAVVPVVAGSLSSLTP